MLTDTFTHIDRRIASWMYRYGHICLRYSLSFIFIWFGLQKAFGVSPAGDLVAKTVYWLDPAFFVPFLGWWEVVIGICLLFQPLVRAAIALLAFQMVGTFLPLVILPEVCFQDSSLFALTLEGQYIIKNVIIISAAIVVGGDVRYQENKKIAKKI